MNIPRSWWVRPLLALLIVPFLSAAATVQSPTLRGKIVDPEGRPVTGLPVSLHHVSETGGVEGGSAVTDREGHFEIDLDETGGDEGGVYFAASRFDGSLYMGEPFRTVAEIPDPYQIVIGIGGIGGGPAMPMPSGESDSRGLGIVILVAALGLVAVLIPFWRGRRGPRAVRALLAELAELDEHQLSAPAEARPLGEAEYQMVRTRLRDRIRVLSGAGSDAADQY
jgi:hypothetical protein